MMKQSLSILCGLLLSGSVLAQAQAQTRTNPVGYYTNMEASDSEDPHFVSGYNLDLYDEKRRLCALLFVATGSPEPVAAIVRGLKYDASKKALKFEAEYQGGILFDKQSGPDGRALKMIIGFSGTVHPNKIVGRMTTREKGCSSCRPEVTQVTLEKLEESD